jgi:hypothetical protein
MMQTEQIRKKILKELPILLQTDTAFRDMVLEIARPHFADKLETEHLFEEIIAKFDNVIEKQTLAIEKISQRLEKQDQRFKELEQLFEKQDQRLEKLELLFEKQDQRLEKLEQLFEKQDQRLEKVEQRLEKQDQRLEKLEQLFEKQDQRLEKVEQRLEKQDQRLEKLEQLFEKQDQRLEKVEQRLEKLEQLFEKQDQRLEKVEQRLEKLEQLFEKQDQRLEKVEQRLEKLELLFEKLEQLLDLKITEDRERWIQHDIQMSKFDQRLMAMGARWGSQSEDAFRNGLAAILKEIPDIEVIHVDEHDDEGIVFGYPEEIELDIIIKNGLLIIVEMKSATDKSDVYRFDKKVRFYEQKHGRKANRKLIISPMVGKKANSVAQKLGIELYTYVQNVKL